MSEREYARGPKFGLETAHGPVIVSMLTPTEAFVACGRYVPGTYYDGQAHVNDDVPTINYRGNDYIGSMRLMCDDTGTWAQRESFPGDRLSRRPQWDKAPVSFQRAIVKAVIAALVSHLATDGDAIAHGAEVADIKRKLFRATSDLDEANAALRTARDNATTLRKLIKALETKLSALTDTQESE